MIKFKIFVRSLRNCLPLGLIFLLLFLIIATYKDYGTTFDEGDMIALGKSALSYYESFGKNLTYLKLSSEPEYFLTHGPIAEAARAIIADISGNHSIDFYHLVAALFAISAFYFIYKITLAITKNQFLAAMSFLLLLVTPRFFGDIFTNTKDIVPAGLILGVIYFAFQYLTGKRKPIHLIAIAVFTGIAVSLRPALGYIYVLFLGTSLFAALSDKKSLRIFFLDQLKIFIIALSTYYLASPYLLQKQLFIIDAISASEKYPFPGAILFQRIMYNPKGLPWYYLPFWISISTPIITLLFFAVGNFYIIRSFLDKEKVKEYILIFIFLIFWFPIVFVFFHKIVIYDAWRQFLFLAGPLNLIAILGLYSLIKTRNKVVIFLTLILLFVNFFVTAKEMIRLHPYEYIYFNSFVGGLSGAYRVYETDYWGASFKVATDWIYQNRNFYASEDGNVYISPCRPFFVIPYLKPGLIIDDGKAKIFYCFTRFDEDKREQGQIIHTVSREGVPLNIIKLKEN